jgi:epoxide hydrolase A/B
MIQHRTIEANGIRMHLAEEGSGPLVVLCHGFPESWYSWRHQLPALAAAGFHAVAPDMRGYGATDAPEEIGRYTLLHLVGDVIGILDALGAKTAVVVGHDWGAPVAWHAALLRPDRFRGVVGLSVPYRPRGTAPPTSLMPQTDDAMFYQLYFQAPGIAEAELAHDVRGTIRRLLYSFSGEGFPSVSARSPFGGAMVAKRGGVLDGTVAPDVLPGWISEADIDVFAGEFAHTGFRGGLNWYRNIDRNWELLASYADARVTVPALYVAGDRDLVVAFPGMDQLIANLSRFVPDLRGTSILPGCGHWTQQERPGEVTDAILSFLKKL